MLVLTRKVGESVIVGEDIRVHVLEIRDGKVRLGIDAPKKIGVHRHEVWMKIQTSGGDPKNQPAGK